MGDERDQTEEILRALQSCTGFQWDDGNARKNWEKHGVATAECEQAFFNQPVLARHDVGHSDAERRFLMFGRTDGGRYLFLAFTLRGDHIRVISARDMNRRERRRYERHVEEA